MTANSNRRKEGFAFRIQREMIRSWDLYLLIIPVLLYYVIFCYYPMYGAQISFRDFRASRGILGSEWVGLEHFQRFFCWRLCIKIDRQHDYDQPVLACSRFSASDFSCRYAE